MNIPTEAVSGFFLGTTPIQYRGDQGHATGFFLNHEDTTYLITNRHVVDVKTHNGDPLETVRIFIRPNPSSVEETEHRDLTLYSDGSKNWITHDDYKVDVAAIPLTSPVTDEELSVPSYNPVLKSRAVGNDEYTMGNIAFSLEDLPSTQSVADGVMTSVIRGGSQAMILGYPLYVPQNKFPVARSALISSPYGVLNQDHPFFRVDARTHGGLSGSPVFTTVTDSSVSVRVQDGGFDVKTAAKLLQDVDWNLIGVHAQSSDQTESLGLNDAYYPHLIADII